MAALLGAALCLSVVGCRNGSGNGAKPKSGHAGSEADPSGADPGEATSTSAETQVAPRPLEGHLVAVRSVDHDLHVTELIRVQSGESLVESTLDGQAEASVFPAATFPDGERVLVLRSSPSARKVGQTVDRLGVWRPWTAGAGTGAVEWFGPAGGRIRNPVLDAPGNFVVFESDQESFRDLYRVRVGSPGETELVRLTDDDEGNFEPAPSPDGMQIAFVSSRDGNPEIYRMGARGEQRRRLTRHPAPDGQPNWSPDGGRIVFVSGRDPSRGDDLFVMRPDGGEIKPLLPARGEVRVEQLRWAPDGKRLAFSETRTISGADVAGRETRVVVATYPEGEVVLRSAGEGRDEWPAWTHDGRLVFSRSLGGDEGRLMMLDARSVPDNDDAIELTSDGVRWMPRWLGPG